MDDDTLHAMDDVYLRRVRDPNPMLEQLARQVCDQYELVVYPARDPVANYRTLAVLAAEAGVPIDYVLDERERRARREVPR